MYLNYTLHEYSRNVILREYKHICINVAYSVPFRFPASSIVGLGLVVGLGTVLVLFFGSGCVQASLHANGAGGYYF